MFELVAENQRGREMASETFDTLEQAKHFELTECFEDWVVEITEI